MIKDITNDPNAYRRSVIDLKLVVNKTIVSNLLNDYIDDAIENQLKITSGNYILELAKIEVVELEKELNGLKLRVIINGTLLGIGLLDKLSSTGKINLNAHIDYAFEEDYYLKLQLNIDSLSWIEQPVMHLGSSKFSLKHISGRILKMAHTKIQNKINENLINLIDITQFVTKVMKEYLPVSILYNQHMIQFQFQNLNINFSDISEDGDSFRVHLKLESVPFLIDQTSNMLFSNSEKIVVKYNEKMQSRIEDISVWAYISFQLLEKLILEKLTLMPIEILNKSIRITNLSIKYISHNRISVRVQSNLKALSSFIISFIPKLNPSIQTIDLTDIKLKLIEGNFITKSMMLFEQPILEYLKRKINPLELAPIISAVETDMQKQLTMVSNEKGIKIDYAKEPIEVDEMGLFENGIKIAIKKKTKIELWVLSDFTGL